jgi:hypothetical protein
MNPQIDFELALASGDLPALTLAAPAFAAVLTAGPQTTASRSDLLTAHGVARLLEAVAS